MSYYKPLKIGNITLEGNLILAPMAGYTDQAFRQVSMENEASLAYTEMASCEALWRGDAEKTKLIMRPYEGEKYLAVQIFSGNLQAVEESIEHVLSMNPAIVDLNIGCPVPKINKNGAGSALMQNTKELRNILTFIKRSLKASMAMTIKLRSGWNQENLNYIEVAGIALDAGASMISLHPRTRTQAYAGSANWQQLKNLKETFPQATICASGDLHTPEAIQKMFEETEVDAAMIARGSIGNPFIFNQTKDLLTRGSYQKTKDSLRIATAYRHYQLMMQYRGERYTISEIKKHLSQYTRGNEILAQFRKVFVLAQESKEVEGLFKELQEKLA